MAKKRTQHEIITLYLASHNGEWVPSYQLLKQSTAFGYLGSQGDRRARELAEDGRYEADGVVYMIERRHLGKYAEYRASGKAKPKMVPRFIERDGRTVVEMVPSL